MRVKINDIKKNDKEKLYFGLYSKIIDRNQILEFIKYYDDSNNKYIKIKIKNELLYFLKRSKRKKLGKLINYFCETKDYKKLLIEKFEEWKYLIDGQNVLEIFKCFNNEEFILKNGFYFIERTNSIKQEKEITKKLKKYEQFIEKYKKIEEILEKNEYYEILKKINYGTLYKIIENNRLNYVIKLFKKYSSSINDIVFLGRGATNSIYKTRKDDNEYIVKVGRERNVFNIKYSKYCLNPYYRKELYTVDNNFICTIEIQDYCRTFISRKKMNRLLKKLNEEKTIWLDISKKNIGILNKDNIRKIPMTQDGFDYSEKIDENECLKKGDTVIIDTDLILSETQKRKKHEVYKTVTNKIQTSIVLYIDTNLILLEAINNILNQTFENYEVLIVIEKNLIPEEKKLLEIDSRFKIVNKIKKTNKIIEYNDEFNNPFYVEKVVD